jgi:hypothetical protein
MNESLLPGGQSDGKQQVRYVAILWKPDVGDGVDVTDAEETGVGRLVLAAHVGIDLSQKDESMKEWLVKTRSNRGKLTLRRCKQALVELLAENGCSGDQESTDWMLDNFPATWHTQLFSGLAGGEWCFAVLTAQDYPLRYVRGCLSGLGSALKQDAGAVQKIQKWLLQPKAEGLNVGLRPQLSSVCRQFADLSGISKVHAVLEEVDKVKAVMEDNIALALDNLESAEELEHRTQQLEAGAQVFQTASVAVRNREWLKGIKVSRAPLIDALSAATLADCVVCCLVSQAASCNRWSVRASYSRRWHDCLEHVRGGQIALFICVWKCADSVTVEAARMRSYRY